MALIRLKYEPKPHILNTLHNIDRGWAYSGISSDTRICRQSGFSSMQSIFAIEATAFSIVEVRQGSVITTNGSRCFGYPGFCSSESMFSPTFVSAPEIAETI